MVGKGDVALQAGNDLSVAGATERNSEQHQSAGISTGGNLAQAITGYAR
ncbi:hypothetical protein Q9R34_18420 [Enterobacter sp. BRE11]|nr:hypothetical protein [Enterobacter sp. BRE11]